MKHINFPVTDEQHEQLEAVKGDRSWHEALLEEFGVDD